MPEADPTRRRTTLEAVEFLRDLLADGGLLAAEVREIGTAEGFRFRLIQKAASKLGVVRTKNGMRGGWIWYVPSQEDAQPESKTRQDHGKATGKPRAKLLKVSVKLYARQRRVQQPPRR